MQIQSIEIAKINPAPYNPRLDLQPGDPEYDKLAKVISEFDLVEPLVWNKQTGNLVGGHQRLKILGARGDKTVEASVVDLTLEKEKALNLALNKTGGDWDMPKLKDLLEELDVGDFDIELTGFDEAEIENLMTQFHVNPETVEDEVPEPPDDPVSRPGDIWQLGRHRLMCGDSTVITNVERLMDGRKAQMTFNDPPYGVEIVQGGWVGGTAAYDIPFGGVKKRTGSVGSKDARGTVGASNVTEAGRYYPVKGDDSTQTAIDTFNLCAALDIPVMIFWGGNYYADALPASSCWIVWDKENTGNFFADAELAWTNQKTAVRVFKHKWNGMIRDSERGQKRVHRTQKPVALAVWCFEQYGKSGGTILDLFGGSGISIMAAEQTSRTALVMEYEPRYCDVIIKRWENFTGGKAVLECQT